MVKAWKARLASARNVAGLIAEARRRLSTALVSAVARRRAAPSTPEPEAPQQETAGGA